MVQAKFCLSVRIGTLVISSVQLLVYTALSILIWYALGSSFGKDISVPTKAIWSMTGVVWTFTGLGAIVGSRQLVRIYSVYAKVSFVIQAVVAIVGVTITNISISQLERPFLENCVHSADSTQQVSDADLSTCKITLQVVRAVVNLAYLLPMLVQAYVAYVSHFLVKKLEIEWQRYIRQDYGITPWSLEDANSAPKESIPLTNDIPDKWSTDMAHTEAEKPPDL